MNWLKHWMNFSQCRSCRILISDSQIETDYASLEKGTLTMGWNFVLLLSTEHVDFYTAKNQLCWSTYKWIRVSGVVVWSFSLVNVAVIFPRKVCGIWGYVHKDSQWFKGTLPSARSCKCRHVVWLRTEQHWGELLEKSSIFELSKNISSDENLKAWAKFFTILTVSDVVMCGSKGT